MAIVIFFVALAALVSLISVPLFEGVLGLAFATPVIALVVAAGLQLLGAESLSLEMPRAVYLISIGMCVLAGLAIFGRRRSKPGYGEFYPLFVLLFIFIGAFYACSQLWPDFIALGERLRDYSLIVSAIHSPFVARESWMEGTPLNYYVFWYRFAAMLHAITGMEVWNIYHASVSLAVALYGAVCFQVVRVVFKAGVGASLLSALLIPFGSNIMGMARLTRTEGGGWGHDFGWWGASRVTRGAITEFPAWSFILGDAHPHYLNLVAVPFLFLVLYRCLVQQVTIRQVVVQSACIVVAGAMFLFGANAWEVPMWLGLAGAVIFVRFCPEAVVWGKRLCGDCGLARCIESLRLACGAVRRSLASKDVMAQICVWLMLLLALKLNSFHIIPEAGRVSWVRDPIAITTTAEALYHWGAHIVVLGLALFFLAPRNTATFILLGAGLFALLFDKAGGLVLLLLVAATMQALRAADNHGRAEWERACVYGLILSGLGLILAPEIVFLDDAYGGADERMNTIFKSYTTAWGLLGLGCSALALRAWRYSASSATTTRWMQRTALSFTVVVYIVGTVYPYGEANFGFYGNVLRQRKMPEAPEYGAEGLGVVDREKPGAAALIRLLRGLPRGRVLESQGNPYSYTTFISTLAAQPSYLGWANHLHLLSKVVGEVDRRQGVTSRIYSSSDCLERLELARSESIRYVVVGSNELEQHPEIKPSDFDCFAKVAEEGEYALFKAR